MTRGVKFDPYRVRLRFCSPFRKQIATVGRRRRRSAQRPHHLDVLRRMLASTARKRGQIECLDQITLLRRTRMRKVTYSEPARQGRGEGRRATAHHQSFTQDVNVVRWRRPDGVQFRVIWWPASVTGGGGMSAPQVRSHVLSSHSTQPSVNQSPAGGQRSRNRRQIVFP